MKARGKENRDMQLLLFIKLIKSFCGGGQGGQFFQKAPPLYRRDQYQYTGIPTRVKPKPANAKEKVPGK
jgi:hypothetical protein